MTMRAEQTVDVITGYIVQNKHGEREYYHKIEDALGNLPFGACHIHICTSPAPLTEARRLNMLPADKRASGQQYDCYDLMSLLHRIGIEYTTRVGLKETWIILVPDICGLVFDTETGKYLRWDAP